MPITITMPNGQSSNLEVQSGQTLRQALSNQGIDVSGFQAYVDGQIGSIDGALRGNETIILAPAAVTPEGGGGGAQAGTIDIRAGIMPGKINSQTVQAGSTVAQALAASGYSAQEIQGFEIRRNGQPAQLNDIVQQNDSLILTRRVQGNR